MAAVPRTQFPEYLDTFPPTAVNASMLVGHNTLRLMVMGMAPARRARQLAMIAFWSRRLTRRARSLRFVHRARLHALPEEMIALCHVVGRHNGAYFTHTDESTRCWRRSRRRSIRANCGVHVEIVHFEMLRPRQLGQGGRALDMIAAARGRGLDVDAISTRIPPAAIRSKTCCRNGCRPAASRR